MWLLSRGENWSCSSSSIGVHKLSFVHARFLRYVVCLLGIAMKIDFSNLAFRMASKLFRSSHSW